jgi:predicted MPP superfamily phosphohydrolase
VTLTLARLAPEFDGYRVVQIGDLHLDDWTKPERLSAVVEKVNGQRPDLIAITGDFASYSPEQLDAQRLTGALRALRARDGCVAILGNHDYLTDVRLVRRCIREGGVTELINGVLTLKRGDAALHVAGIDDVMEGRSRLDLVAGSDSFAGFQRGWPFEDLFYIAEAGHLTACGPSLSLSFDAAGKGGRSSCRLAPGVPRACPVR